MYRAFFVQEEAFKFSKKNNDTPLWGRDRLKQNDEMVKKYVVAGYRPFYEHYSTLDPKDRNHYEMITSHCHLYFDIDLEYKKIPPELTAAYDGDEYEKRLRGDILNSIEEFVDEVERTALRLRLADTVTKVVLDSSNAEKLSKHIIFKLSVKGIPVVFKSNRDCDNFRMHVLQNWGDIYDLIDESVYTKNRLFRLVGSSKLGKDRIFFNSGNSLLPPKDKEWPITLTQFLSTLVTHMPIGAKIVECDPTLLGKRKGSKFSENAKKIAKYSVGIPECAYDIAKAIETEWNDGSCVTPFNFDPLTSTVIFSSSSRFCRTKGDEHKGNHIFFTSMLKKKTYTQRCHSVKEACYGYDGEGNAHHYTSHEIQIPKEIHGSIDSFFAEFYTFAEQYIEAFF